MMRWHGGFALAAATVLVTVGILGPVSANVDAPVVLATSPDDGQGDVVIGLRSLEMNFSSPVAAGAGDIVVRFMFDEQVVERIPVADPSKVNFGDQGPDGSWPVTIMIDSQTLRRELGNYFVQIAEGVFVSAGGAPPYAGTGPKTTWNFRCGKDTAPPFVIQSSPGIGETNFPMRSTVIHLQMDEHVRTGWADGYIRVSRAFGLGGVGQGMLLEDISVHDTDKVQVANDTVTVTIEETTTAMYEMFDYRVEISEGAFKDVAETPNAFEGLMYTFQTGFDHRPPVIISETPSNGGQIPVQSTTLAISFDKLVEKGTGNIHIYKKVPAGDPADLRQTVAVTSFNVFVFYTTVLVTISANAVNEEAQTYYVLMDPGTFRDKVTYPNEFLGINDSSVWTFTTLADTTRPTIKTTDPPFYATGIPPSIRTVQLVLTENVRQMANGTIMVRTDNTDCNVGCGILETIAANDMTKVHKVFDSINGATITIDIHPYSVRTEHTWHSIVISGNAFLDYGTASPNYFLGTEPPNAEWRFQTGVDTAPPLVLPPSMNGTVPTVDDQEVTVVVPELIFEFDEKVVPVAGAGSQNDITLERRDSLLANGDWVLQESWSITSPALDFSGGNVLRVAVAFLSTHPDRDVPPWTTLRRNSAYRVVIAPGVLQDTATVPNAFLGFEYQFHTRLDEHPPVIMSTVPAYGQDDVPLRVNGIRTLSDSTLTLRFSESVVANAGTIRVYEMGVTCDASDPLGCCGHAHKRIEPQSGTESTGACNCTGGYSGPTCNIFEGNNAQGENPVFGQLRETIDVTNSDKVSFDVEIVTIMLDPQTLKKEYQQYYVQVDATAFKDTAVNPNLFAGILDTSFNFSMAADLTPPDIVSVHPVSGATVFFGHFKYSIELDEPIQTSESRNVEEKEEAVLQVKQTLNPFKTVTVDCSNMSSVVTYLVGDDWRSARSVVEFIIPDTFLTEESRQYAIHISSTCLKDIASSPPNFFPGIHDDASWTFFVQPNANVLLGRGAGITLGGKGASIGFKVMNTSNSGFRSNAMVPLVGEL